MTAVVQSQSWRNHVVPPAPQRRTARRLLPAAAGSRPPAPEPSEQRQLDGPSAMLDGAFPRSILAAGLAALRAAAEDAEQMERGRALAKLRRPSQADAHVLEQLGTRLVEGLIAYLAARMAECAADPDGGVVLARLFAPPT